MTEEQYCHQMLDLLTQQYQKDCRPFTERLVRLMATRPVVMYVLDPSVLTGSQVQMLTDLDIHKNHFAGIPTVDDPIQKETPDLSGRG